MCLQIVGLLSAQIIPTVTDHLFPLSAASLPR